MRPRLETERLVLRSWRDGDGPALRHALDVSDAHLRPWVPFMKHEPRTLAATCQQVVRFGEQFRAAEVFRWAVLADSPDGQILVGEVLLMHKGDAPTAIGYWLSVEHVGRGYAREAIQAVLAQADQAGTGVLEAFVDVDNDASNTLIARLGFQLDRVQDVEGDKLNVWLRRAGAA